ncbi:MAG: group 1 truncated hemoglobin [Planctomycetota bacterium]
MTASTNDFGWEQRDRRTAVEEFYRRMLADERVARFFDGVDMTRQAAKQKAFIAMATGGPNNYTGKDMADGHRCTS